jgi:hypothetical protein
MLQLLWDTSNYNLQSNSKKGSKPKIKKAIEIKRNNF